MEYAYAYDKIKDYAKIHNLELEFGLYSTKVKEPDFLSENKVLTEININLFIITKFKGDNYVIILKEEAASNINKLNSVLNIIRGFSDALIVTHDVHNTKIQNLILENLPKLNYINLPVFIKNPMNSIYAPKEVFKLNFAEEEKIIMAKKKDLMEINFIDPLVAWFRFKPGDIICLLYPSFVSGFDTHYRFVEHFTK